jgi:undecaprenyl phosphate-alpha-L-ara4FN deformylase
VREDGFNAYILHAARACGGVPVYTIHAEVEGVSRVALFADFLEKAGREGIRFCPLRELLPSDPSELPCGDIELRPFPGREGTLGVRTEQHQGGGPRGDPAKPQDARRGRVG